MQRALREAVSVFDEVMRVEREARRVAVRAAAIAVDSTYGRVDSNARDQRIRVRTLYVSDRAKMRREDEGESDEKGQTHNNKCRSLHDAPKLAKLH